ncbi:hypothetical protein L1887_16680 [Cichorium endivia]|nr:hypothetical protein L1887_16680 [Cichorium endivia]
MVRRWLCRRITTVLYSIHHRDFYPHPSSPPYLHFDGVYSKPRAPGRLVKMKNKKTLTKQAKDFGNNGTFDLPNNPLDGIREFNVAVVGFKGDIGSSVTKTSHSSSYACPSTSGKEKSPISWYVMEIPEDLG